MVPVSKLFVHPTKQPTYQPHRNELLQNGRKDERKNCLSDSSSVDGTEWKKYFPSESFISRRAPCKIFGRWLALLFDPILIWTRIKWVIIFPTYWIQLWWRPSLAFWIWVYDNIIVLVLRGCPNRLNDHQRAVCFQRKWSLGEKW